MAFRPGFLLTQRVHHLIPFTYFFNVTQLEQHFVVRLIPDVIVHKGGRGRRLRKWHIGVGQAVDLGELWVRQDRAVKTRVIGLWARGQKEPWWLATDSKDSLADVVALYDRRMAIEQQIRDTKGCRFGVKLEWAQFKKPQYLSRFVLLVAVALALWTAVGQAVEEQNPGVRLPCKRKGPRLSLLRVGISFLKKVSRMVYIGVKFVKNHLPPPALRIFGSNYKGESIMKVIYGQQKGILTFVAC